MYYSERAAYQNTEAEMRLKAWRMAPVLWWNRLHHGRALDILISHAPPFGIHDGEDRCHTGFRTFLRMMDLYRPRYLVHGHQHIYSPSTTSRTTYRETQVINTYNYQVIEWDQPDTECEAGAG